MPDNWPLDIQFPTVANIQSITNWKECTKQIYNQHDVSHFQNSVLLHNIQGSLFKFCSLVAGESIPSGVLDDSLVSFEQPRVSTTLLGPKTSAEELHLGLSPQIKCVLDLIHEFYSIIEHHPPLPGPRRYGNMACRAWHDELRENIDRFLDSHLLQLYKFDNFAGLKLELRHYILNSFGSRERLDYGTGHELSFLAFFNGLIMGQVLDLQTLTGQDVLAVFSKYYDLIKTLILNYTLEPAGSHGVWGLDDHFHLIYILGSAQFISVDKPQQSRVVPSPSSVLKSVTLQKYRTSNLYFNAISFIKKVKTGPFNEHSPILYDVSAVKTWKKVNQGMIKMWFVEVLSKFPVVQHFYFGNVLYPWRNLQGEELPKSTEKSESLRQEEQQQHKKPDLATRMSHQDVVVTKAPWLK